MRSAALLGLLILAGSTPAVAQRAPWDPGPALVEGAYCRRPQRAPNTGFVVLAGAAGLVAVRRKAAASREPGAGSG
jgi:hypothetical protein